jgi:molybdenum cofactor biosynthesis protein A
MPEEGIPYLPKKDLLTFEEIIRLATLMARMGISKIRITGGEPFVRTDLMHFLRELVAVPEVKEVHITTNGVLTAPFVPELKSLGIASVNLSLDSLDPKRFRAITRRNEIANVLATLDSLLDHRIPVKVNAVVMAEKNLDDIIPLAELTRAHPISVRFIEEMPFNGSGTRPLIFWNHRDILKHLQGQYPNLQKIADPSNATASHFKVPGYAGTLGIIAAYSRTFCGTCNRLRITAQGMLKTCLYDDGVLDIRALLRSSASDEALRAALMHAFRNRSASGFEAEQRRSEHPVHESMSTIGG